MQLFRWKDMMHSFGLKDEKIFQYSGILFTGILEE